MEYTADPGQLWTQPRNDTILCSSAKHKLCSVKFAECFVTNIWREIFAAATGDLGRVTWLQCYSEEGVVSRIFLANKPTILFLQYHIVRVHVSVWYSEPQYLNLFISVFWRPPFILVVQSQLCSPASLGLAAVASISVLLRPGRGWTGLLQLMMGELPPVDWCVCRSDPAGPWDLEIDFISKSSRSKYFAYNLIDWLALKVEIDDELKVKIISSRTTEIQLQDMFLLLILSETVVRPGLECSGLESLPWSRTAVPAYGVLYAGGPGTNC